MNEDFKMNRFSKLSVVVAVILSLIGGLTGAVAQTPVTTGNEFQTATRGKTVVGFVLMCIDAVTKISAPCATTTGVGGSIPSFAISQSVPGVSNGVVPLDSTGTQVTWNNSFYPNGFQPSVIAASGSAAVATATMASNTKTVYISGVSITGTATAATAVDCTVTGLSGGTITIRFNVSTTAVLSNPFNLTPTLPMAGAGNGQDVALSCPSFGAGGISRLILTGGTM